MFPSILQVFYGILTFFCITFDALEMHLIVTDVVVTLTVGTRNSKNRKVYAQYLRFLPVAGLRFTLYTHRHDLNVISCISPAELFLSVL